MKYDVIIIGAGIAGLTASVYVLRAGHTALCIEGANYGGQIVNSPEVENYPGFKNISGFDLVQAVYEQAKDLGMEYKNDKIDSVIKTDAGFTVKGESEFYECDAVIIATGAKRRKLGVPGEDSFAGMGVSYCATCDGMFYRKKKTVVCGGGNTALEDAMFLSNICEQVTICHRRDGFRGEPKILALLREKDNVHFVTDVTVDEIAGGAKAERLLYTDHKTGEKGEIRADGIFVAVGQIPDTEFVKDLVKLDEAGYIAAGEDCRTSVPGIFTAGDCRSKQVRQLTTAAADGTVAGLSAAQYIEKK